MNPPAPPLGSRERELLLLAARVDLTPEQSSRLRELARGPIAWELLVWYAQLHSVAPLLGHHVRQVSPVPREARRPLLALCHRTEYQNQIYAHEHARIVDALAGERVRPLVPKGLALVELVYRKRALRPLIDLVFIVRPADAAAVRRAFARCGYVEARMHPLEGLYRWACPRSIFHGGSDLRVDVIVSTTAVTTPRVHRFSIEEVFARAREGVVGGRPALLFGREDQVLYLALQADLHGAFNSVALGRMSADELLFATWTNNRLIRFTDLYETIRREQDGLEWEALVRRARETGVAEPVATSLELTNRLLGPVVPPEVVAGLGSPRRHVVRTALLEGALADSRSLWLRLGEARRLRATRVLAYLDFLLPGSAVTPTSYPRHLATALARSATSSTRLLAAAARARVGPAGQETS